MVNLSRWRENQSVDVSLVNSRVMGMDNRVENTIVVNNTPIPSPARGNLTGNPRKVRDTAADLYSLVQKWNLNTISGSEVITSIANLKTQASDDTSSDQNNPPLLPNGLQARIDILEAVLKDLDSIVEKMTKLRNQMQAMAQLEQFKFSTTSPNPRNGNKPSPLFITWPADKFYDVFSELCDAYAMELKVRQCILENIAFCKHRDALMFYLTAWSRQVHITDHHRLLIEALLCETGHR